MEDSDGWVSISEATGLTGLSRKALEGRVQRGTLPAEKRGGRVFVPVSELHRQGLVPGSIPQAVDARDLLDRLERQAEELGRLRAELERLRRRETE